METKTVKLYSLDYSNAKTYLMAALFIAGNMALPQLFHLIPQGGITWLPIYFFTLIGAYKFGWKVGLLTAVLSPVINSLLFGMPLPAVLPAIFQSIAPVKMLHSPDWRTAVPRREAPLPVPDISGIIFRPAVHW